MDAQRDRAVLRFITELRNSHSQMQNIFLFGSCMNMFCILRTIFPESVAYYDGNHVITKIGDRFYDITGRVNPAGYVPFTSFKTKRRTSRAFNQMYRREYGLRKYNRRVKRGE